MVDRYAKRDFTSFFRADAAFALLELYACLESKEYHYAIRFKSNVVLVAKAAQLLKRPVGRPPNYVRRFYHEFQYQAGSWDQERRVVAKIEWHPGDLFPQVGFIVTNFPFDPQDVLSFYNQRGKAEQLIKGGKYAVNWTRLSCHGFAHNAVRL